MRTRAVERSILHYVNVEREKRNLPALSGHPALIEAARGHSGWMADTGVFDHLGKHRSEPSERLDGGHRGFRSSRQAPGQRERITEAASARADYRGGVGENIWQTPTRGGRGGTWKSRFRWSNERELGKAAVISWMNSPVHRENMLSDDWRHIGIGVARSKRGQAYLTQCFGNGMELSTGAVDLSMPKIRVPRSIRRLPRNLKRLPRNLKRLPRGLKRLPRGLKRVPRGLKRVPRRLRRTRWGLVAKRAAVVALVVYVGLMVYHLSNGLNFGDSLRGPLLDVRVTAGCLGDWGAIEAFVTRETLWGVDLIGSMPPSAVCP